MKMTLDTNHPEWRAFVLAMRANRYDDTPRLVFCDWLEEKFGPNSFATFIREQIEYCREFDCVFSPVLDAFVSRVGVTRVAKVMSPEWHRERKIAGLFSRCYGPSNWNVMNGLDENDKAMWFFGRGFPDAVVCQFEWWERNARNICGIGPVGSLILTDYPQVVRKDLLDGRICYRMWGRSESIIVDSNPNDAARHAAIENLLKMVWKPGEEVESLRIMLP